MATHVHMKLDERAILRLINAIQVAEAQILNWKCGPYMRNTKINKVSIAHWPKNGTLMLQGPETETNLLNERIQNILRYEEEQDRYENANPNRHVEVAPRPQKDWQNDNSIGGSESIIDKAITRTNIEDLLRFIRKWENTNLCIEDARTGTESREEEIRIVQRQHDEAAHVMRENRAINKFKCEILTYMQQEGLVHGKGAGKRESARKPMRWVNES